MLKASVGCLQHDVRLDQVIVAGVIVVKLGSKLLLLLTEERVRALQSSDLLEFFGEEYHPDIDHGPLHFPIVKLSP